MPPRLRRLSARDVLAVLKDFGFEAARFATFGSELKEFGFEVVATRGSHAKLRRVSEDGETETLTVPLHKDLDVGTIRAIYRQAARFIPEAELRSRFYAD